MSGNDDAKKLHANGEPMDAEASADKKSTSGASKRKFDERELCSLVKQRDELSKQLRELSCKIDDQEARKRLIDACASVAKTPHSAVLIDGDALRLALEDGTLISEGLVLVHDKLTYRWPMEEYDGEWTYWDESDDGDLFHEATGVVYDERWELGKLLTISKMLQRRYDDEFSNFKVNSIDTGKRSIHLLEAEDMGLVIEKAKWDRLSANFERRKKRKA